MIAKDENENLKKWVVGGVPLIMRVIEELGLRKLLEETLGCHGNEKISVADSLTILTAHLVLGRHPLYEINRWVLGHYAPCFGFKKWISKSINDDRFSRALDRLYETDRASLITQVAVAAVKNFGIDLKQVHNDSTSVKAYGRIKGKTKSGLQLRRGHSKDHRPDLKQLVFSLTISSDGAVPIHYKTYSGNRTDDTTHKETWNALRTFTGRSDFLYVADCKVCTQDQLAWITRHGGRVVTVIPETWKEVHEFKAFLRAGRKFPKKQILKRKPTTPFDEAEYYSCFDGNHKTHSGHTVYWIYSSAKKKRDRIARKKLLNRVESKLTDLMSKLNTRKFKAKEQILAAAEEILREYGVVDFYVIRLGQVNQVSAVQSQRGRPGINTEYQTKVDTIYTLAWARNKKALLKEQAVDGVFPLLSTDPSLTAKHALLAYKFQPRLEKRFSQFKNIHRVAPLLYKRIDRVESMLCVFFLALLVQSLIERQVRLAMKNQKIEGLPIYPEHRLSFFPTTVKVLDQFDGVSKYHLMRNGKKLREFSDPLTPTQKSILKLFKIKEDKYWNPALIM